jgi:hypothetical protein
MKRSPRQNSDLSNERVSIPNWESQIKTDQERFVESVADHSSQQLDRAENGSTELGKTDETPRRTPLTTLQKMRA